MNIQGKQKYLKESKKDCRKAKTFEGKQNYLKESNLKENKAIFKRILTPQGHRIRAIVKKKLQNYYSALVSLLSK